MYMFTTDENAKLKNVHHNNVASVPTSPEADEDILLSLPWLDCLFYILKWLFFCIDLN